MTPVRTFKVDDKWSFEAQGHVETGFATKDEAQMAGEKYLIDKRREEKKKAKEEQEE